MIMPSVVSGTGPYPNADFCWVGEPIQHNQALRDSAISLYLAMMVHECMLLIGSAGPTYIEGPLSSDKQFAEMLASVSGRPVMFTSAQTGTSVGAALLVKGFSKPPTYEVVSPKSARCDQLVFYAKLWKKQLMLHIK